MTTEDTIAKNKPSWSAPIESRGERADYYFQTVLENQREWYSTKAGIQKIRHLILAISVVLIGALISCLQVITADIWVRYLTSSGCNQYIYDAL